MLRPEYLDGAGDELVVLFGELETSIEVDIARRILKGKYVTATAAWQREKLLETFEFGKFLEKRLKETMWKADIELKETLKESAKASIVADDKIFKEGLGEVSVKAEWINGVINAGYVETRKRLKNFCNSMGSVAVGEFSKYIDLAYIEIKSGAFTADQAISQAVNSLAREGIYSIEYASGKNICIEAGVRRAVLSGVNRTACEVSLQRAEELGVDLVKTTEHLGARPEHAEWQGRVFSLSGSGKYPNFYEETGYGDIEGLGGVNCRHSFYPFFEEVEDNRSQDAQIGDSKRNERMYEVEQEQRYNERKIREWKRRAEVMESGGQNNGEEINKVKEWQGRQRELVLKNKLARQYAREKVY